MRVSKDYYRLIERFPLLHIRSDEQLEHAQILVDELVDKLANMTITAGEKEYLDALTDLVVAYESKRFHPENKVSPVELVRFLMNENGLSQTDIAPLFGGQSRVSDFLSGKRPLSKGQIQKLAEHFRLSPAAFMNIPRRDAV